MNFSVNDYFSRFERIILNQNVDVFKVKNKSTSAKLISIFELNFHYHVLFSRNLKRVQRKIKLL